MASASGPNIFASASLWKLASIFLALTTSFHHHDAVLAAGNDQVERALLALFVRRVDDVAAVHHADADARDRLLERDFRQREGGGGARDGEHVAVVFGVGREQHRDDLRLVSPSFSEQRTDRAVDQAAGET